jgi:hypothetical protein
VISKSPMGYLLCWLACAGDFPDKGTHMAARFERDPGSKLSYKRRLAARVEAADNPEFALAFEWEGAGAIEPVELGNR